MAVRLRKFWGWGYEGEGPTAEQQEKIAALLAARFGIAAPTVQAAPRIEEIDLRAAARRAADGTAAVLLDQRRSTAPAIPTASRFATSCAPSRATSPTRPTSSPIRATKPR